MADTQSTTKFRADISQLKKEMQAASRAVRLASSEFKAATAGMDDWSASADGLQAKLKQLSTTLESQKKILALQEKELEKTVAEYGENSAAADRVRIAVNNQKAAIKKTESELKKYGDQLGDTSDDLDDVNEALEDTEDGTSAASDGFTVMKGVLANLAATAIKKAVEGLKDLAKQAVKTGSEFEAEMSKVEAISGATASEMANLNEKAKEMGSSTMYTAKETAEAFEYMAMAGWSTSDMLEGIEGVLNLAASSGTDLATASDIVTDALTAMGYEAKDAGRLADVMASASANANTNVELMGKTFQYVAPIIGALGYDMEDAAVAIGVMANAGIKGEKAGTALRSILTRLSAPPKECAEEMEKLGITLTDSEGNMKDMSEVTDDLRKAFSGMSKTEQTAAAKHIAGQEAMSGLLAIVNAAPKDFEKLEKAIDNSAGAAEEMAETMQDNLQGSITEFESAAEGLGIAVYEGVAGPLADLVDTATGAIQAITEAITPERTTLDDYLSEVEQSIEQTEKAIESARSAIENGEADAARLETYKQILLETNGSLDDFSQYQIKSIVDELADSIPELAAAWDENTKSLDLTNEEIEALIGNSEAWVLQQSQMEARASAMKAYTNAQVDAAKAQSAFNQALEEASKESGQTFETMAEAVRYYSQTGVALTDTYNRLVDANQKVGQSNANVEEAKDLYDLTDKALSEMDITVESAGETMEETAVSAETLATETEALSTSAGIAAEAYVEAGDKIAEAFETAKDEAEKAFSVNPFDSWSIDGENGIAKMQEALDSQIAGLTDYGDNLDVVRQNLAQTAPEFVGYLEDMGAGGAQVVKELAAAFENGDTSTVEALLNSYIQAMDVQDELSSTIAADQTAIDAGLGKLGSSARDWAQLTDVVDALKDSGSTLTEETAAAFEKAAETARSAGVAIPDGLQEGIAESDDAEAAVIDAIDAINSAIEGQGQALMDIAAEQGIKVPDGIKEGIEAGGEGAAEAYRALLALITGDTGTATTDAAGNGKDIADATAAGISDNSDTAESAGREMAEAAVDAEGKASAESLKVGTDAGKSFTKGVSENAGQAGTAGKQVADAAVKGVSTALSPSSKAGTASGTQFASGMAGTASNAKSAGKTVASAGVSGASDGSKGMSGAGQTATTTYASGITSKGDSAKAAGSSVAASAKSGAENVSAYSSGELFSQGFINGIGAKVSAAFSKAYELARQAWAGLKKGQQEGSPSKLTTQSGKYFTQGYINGIASGMRNLMQTVEKLAVSAVKKLGKASASSADDIGRAASDQFGAAIDAKSEYIISKAQYKNEQKIAEFDKQIEKLQEKSDKKNAEIQKASAKKVKKLQQETEKEVSRQQKASDKSIKALQAKMDATSDKDEKARLKKEISDQEKATKALIKTIEKNGKKAVEAEEAASDKQVKANEKKYEKLIATQEKYREAYQVASDQMLDELTKSMDSYSQTARQLVDDAISGVTERYTAGYDALVSKQENLVDKMLSVGSLYDISPAGIMTVNDLSEQTRQIKDYASKLEKVRKKVSAELFDEIATMETREGSAYMDRLLSMSSKDLKAYDKAYTDRLKAAQAAGAGIYAADFKKLKATYKAEIKEAMSDVEKELETLGTQAMKGFVNGLTTNTSYMEKNVKTFIQAMLKTFKSELKIKSPSKVTFGIGAYTGEGMVDGLMSMIRRIRAVVDEITGMISSPLSGITTDISGVGQSVKRYPAGVTTTNVQNTYNLVQNNTSPKSLSALDTYQARRQQIAMVKAALN